MSNIEHLLDEVIAREGGYSNHHADKGGATNWGITQAVAAAHGYHGAMRDLSQKQARQIYREKYWQAPRFADVARYSNDIAAELFDTGVNMGPKVAIAFLQRVLNALNRNQKDYPDIMVDRSIGPETLGALKKYCAVRGKSGQAVFVRALNALQGERYITLAENRPANEAFLYGWLANRLA